MKSNPPFVDAPTCSHDALWEALYSSYHLPILLVADEVGLFSKLHETPATCAEVARDLELSERSAEIMLGVLASHQHLVQLAGKFHLTDSSRQFLLPGSPFYAGGVMELRRKLDVNHKVVKDAFFKDAPAFSGELNSDNWVSEPTPDQLRAFTATMHSMMFPSAIGVAMKGNFAGVERLLDIAGGSGCYCMALAMRYPDLQLTVLELPGVCELIPGYAGAYGLEDRIETHAADMFKDDFPAGFDAHFYSNIFHDWDASRCRALAEKSFAALPSGGRIYLHEALVNETRDGPRLTLLYSMNILAWTSGGKQYSASELTEILTGAGFEDVRVTPAYSRFSLLSARKP